MTEIRYSEPSIHAPPHRSMVVPAIRCEAAEEDEQGDEVCDIPHDNCTKRPKGKCTNNSGHTATAHVCGACKETWY